MRNTKRTGMVIEMNNGQWHSDIERVHTYDGGEWVIIFTGYRGSYDSVLGICVMSTIEIKVMATKAQVLKNGIKALVDTGEIANLIMRNNVA